VDAHESRKSEARRVRSLASALAVLACLALLVSVSSSAQAPTEAAPTAPTPPPIPTTPDDALEAGVVEGDPAEQVEDDGLPKVVLATFTTEISDREPVDNVSFLGNDKRVVYFFTDLRNMKGQTIRHVWAYKGKEMGGVDFEVKGARWRVWSSKQLLPDWLGEWTVSVTSPAGEVLATEAFTYQASP